MKKYFMLLTLAFFICPATLTAQDTSLHMAAGSGDLARIQNLISAGLGVNDKMSGGFTPLMVAAKYGHSQIIDTLIRVGRANINLANNEGNTALMVAVTSRQANSVRALLTHNANIQIKNNRGMDAMAIARLIKNEEILKLLNDYKVPKG